MKKFIMLAIIPLLLFAESCTKDVQPAIPDFKSTMYQGTLEKETPMGIEKYNIKLEFFRSLEELSYQENAIVTIIPDNLRYTVSRLSGEDASVYEGKYIQNGANIKIYHTSKPLDEGEYWIIEASGKRVDLYMQNGTTEVRLYLTRLSL